ncbi:MAG: HIT family protein [Methyloligellaceae bacterium]
MTYDNDNIFAKILRDELPCHKVYEDENTLAFLDIMPRADGHTLVIPKQPSRNILDLDPQEFVPLLTTTQKIARAAMKAFAADGLVLQQFNEAAGGQEVFHLHFHILPRFEGVKLRPPGTMADTDVLVDHAQRLRTVLEQSA